VSLVDDILGALGLGGGSLTHIKKMAESVQPAQIEAMAAVFDHGTQVFNTGHGHLESAIDNVVGGWKGDAARAASTSVLSGAMTSRASAESSSSAADNVRSYAAQLRQTRSQILAVPTVDTSMGHAVQASGGPVMAALNPGAVAANMMAAQIQSEQNREQAAGYLQQMNDQSEQFAAQQQQTFQAVPPPKNGYPDNLPSTVSVHAPSASGGGGAMPAVRGPSGGGSGPTWSAPGPGGPGVHPVKNPYDNGGRPSTGGGNPPNGPGNPTQTPTPPSGPVEVLPPPGDTTPGQGANPPGGITPSGPPVALPDPAGAGSSGPGLGTAALLGGGAAAVAAGGVAGWNRAGLGGRAAFAGGDGAGASGGRAGAGGLAEGEHGLAGGRGFGGAADEASGRFGAGGRGGVGGFDPAEESALRAGRLSAATAGELAAGERGMMPPMGGAGGRRSDDEELEKRPDYLVETDDVWGDGRLAAPPVLG